MKKSIVVPLFCPTKIILLESSSVISQEGGSSISSRAGANSCVQSPNQHDGLAAAFSNSILTDYPEGDDLYCFEVADDPGAGPSKVSGDVSRLCSNEHGDYEGGRQTPTTGSTKRKLSDDETSCDRCYESGGTDCDKDHQPTQQGEICRSLRESEPDSPLSGGCTSRPNSCVSTISSGSDRHSRSSSRTLCASSASGMVHGNDRELTPGQSQHPKDKGTTPRTSTPTYNPAKKVKSIPSNTEDQEGKRTVYYWSYYKCPAPGGDNPGGSSLGGRPGIDPDPKRLRGASRNPRFILADHTGDEYPHAHIHLACSPGGGTRGLRRCLAFLQSTAVQIAEATANLQRVVVLEKCVAYMGKYGPDSIFFMGKAGRY